MVDLLMERNVRKNLERLAFQFVSDYSTVAVSMTRLLFMPTFSKILVINFTNQSNAAITSSNNMLGPIRTPSLPFLFFQVITVSFCRNRLYVIGQLLCIGVI